MARQKAKRPTPSGPSQPPEREPAASEDTEGHPGEELEGLLGQLPEWQGDLLGTLPDFGVDPAEVLALARTWSRGTLTPKQRSALSTMTRLLLGFKKVLGEHHWTPIHGLEHYHKQAWWGDLSKQNKDHLVRLLQDYDRAIVRAEKADLKDLSLVARRLSAMRALEDSETLRDLRLPREKGVKSPIPDKDLLVWDAIGRHPEWWGQGSERIRRALIRQGLIQDISKQGFHKLLGRLNLLGPPREVRARLQEDFGDPPSPVQPHGSASDTPVPSTMGQVEADHEKQRRR